MGKPMQREWRKDEVPQDFIDLCGQIRSLPLAYRQKLLPLCDRVGHFTRLQSRLVKIAQEAVDQLQLDVKYLTFDLEVTQRERDSYRQHMEDE